MIPMPKKIRRLSMTDKAAGSRDPNESLKTIK
jgi:hypothetical protein